MSDNPNGNTTPNNDKISNSDEPEWSQLDVQSLKKYSPEDIKIEKSDSFEKDEIFSILYEREKNEGDKFVQFDLGDSRKNKNFEEFNLRPDRNKKQDKDAHDNEIFDIEKDTNIEGKSIQEELEAKAQQDAQAIASEIELIKQQAYKTGFAKGEQEGYRAGFTKAEKEGYDSGYARGEQEGIESVQKRSEDVINNLSVILQNINNIWDNLVITNEKQILEMIYRICEKIVYSRAEIENDIVRKTIIQVLKLIPEPVNITISINPEDYEYIELNKEDFFIQVKSLQQVSVIANPAIERGGCKIETPSGEINTSIEARLEAVRRSILEVSGSKSI